MKRSVQGAVLAGLILAGNAAYVASAMGPLHRSKSVLETDHRTYMEMAWAPAWQAEVEPPFCWRLLTPLLVYLLMKTGLGMNAAYYLLTNLALFGFLFCLHHYLRLLGFDARYSAVGLLLAGLLPGAVRWYEYQYWMTDPLSLFLTTLAFVLIQQERHGALAGLGALALANRETFVLVFPYYLLRRLRCESWPRALARTLLVGLPALLVLVWIRYVLLPHPAEDVWATLRENLAFRWRHVLDNQLYFVSLGSFGVLLPLALLQPRRAFSYLRRHLDELAVLVVVYASLAVANNTDRLLVYALPVLLPGALKGLRGAMATTGLPFAPVAAVVLALQLVFYQQTLFHGHQGISIFQPTNWIVIASLLGFWAAALLLLRRHGGSHAHDSLSR